MILYTPKIMPERHVNRSVWKDKETGRRLAFRIGPADYNAKQLDTILKLFIKTPNAGIVIFNIQPGKGTLWDDISPLQPEFTTITPYHIEEMRQLPLEGQERVIENIAGRILTASRTLLIDMPV